MFVSKKLSYAFVAVCALFLSMGTMLAQNVNVAGKVTDKNGEPIVGAYVVIEGTRTGATTDIDGAYKLSAPAQGALVFSCVSQPNIPNAVVFTKSTFADCWSEMLDHLSALGMHRLMVEPGAGLAKQLFADVAATSAQKPLWNRLDLWRSTDHTIEDALASFIDEGSVVKTLDFPAIPEKLIAKESFMVGPDVLTVFYPG